MQSKPNAAIEGEKPSKSLERFNTRPALAGQLATKKRQATFGLSVLFFDPAQVDCGLHEGSVGLDLGWLLSQWTAFHFSKIWWVIFLAALCMPSIQFWGCPNPVEQIFREHKEHSSGKSNRDLYASFLPLFHLRLQPSVRNEVLSCWDREHFLARLYLQIRINNTKGILILAMVRAPQEPLYFWYSSPTQRLSKTDQANAKHGHSISYCLVLNIGFLIWCQKKTCPVVGIVPKVLSSKFFTRFRALESSPILNCPAPVGTAVPKWLPLYELW